MARERDDDVDDRDDDDDRPRRRSGGGSDELSGLDKFFANTPVVIILAIVFCFCSPVGVILGGIGVFTCKNPDSKRNATIMLILGIIGQVTGAGKQ